MDKTPASNAREQDPVSKAGVDNSRSDVVVAHNAAIAGVTCMAASLLLLAWLGRAVAAGTPWDWLAVLVLALIAGIELSTWRDARAPLLVADHQGVRLRRRDQWVGFTWQALAEVVVLPRNRIWKDGWIRITPGDGSGELSVPLSLTTTVSHRAVLEELNSLAAGRCAIRRAGIGAPDLPPETQAVAAQVPAAAKPVRPIRPPRRLDLQQVSTVAPAQVPAQREEPARQVVLVPEPEPETSRPLLIGGLLLAARDEAGLSLAALSERTQIRPHVLEGMEADDFSRCGGDFYARGHLRSVCHRLGLDQELLLSLFEEHFAQAPVEVREVFESDLQNRVTERSRVSWGTPRWGLLLTGLAMIGSIWAGIQLLADPPTEMLSPAPNVVDSVGLSGSVPGAETPQSKIATLTVQARDIQSDVVVRDESGRIVWAGRLMPGQSHRVFGYAPFNVAASHAAKVQLRLLGKDIGPVGRTNGGADRLVSLPTGSQTPAE